MKKQLRNQNLKFSILNKNASFFCSILLVFVCSISIAGASIISKKTKLHNSIRPDSAQREVISYQSATEIKYQAEAVVHIYELVLNSISFNDNTPTELAGFITNSFTPNKRYRVFYNNNVIIEDDLDPKSGLGISKDITADKYLNELDLNYEKTPDFSIKFSNIVTSNVKKTDHIYVRVKFDSNFGSKYKVDGSHYATRQREALVRMEPSGKKKWNAFIEGISYFDPNKAITNKDNDMQVVYTVPTDDEDDDSPKFILAKNKIAPAKKAAAKPNEKPAQYPDFGFDFKNFKTPDVAKINPVFHIKITFESDFGVKDTVSGKSGPIRQGEAYVRIERNGNTKWNAVIETISFHKQKRSSEIKDNDLETVPNDPAMVAGIAPLLDESIKMAMLPTQGESKKETKKAK